MVACDKVTVVYVLLMMIIVAKLWLDPRFAKEARVRQDRANAQWAHYVSEHNRKGDSNHVE